ncbi:MAG TPA: cupin domain-containing protein [Chitinophagaceae bacterium]|nr:cupin domain-containing protein [Chitinophagaceae bacterium]
MLQINIQAAVCQKPTLENSIHYIAHTFSFLTTGEQTDHAFSLIHCNFRKGFMVSPHYHTLEEESFYILEGEIDFHVGHKKYTAGAGEFMVLPKNIPHHFNLVTETANALLLITPAGYETFFKECGTPAVTLHLPPIPTENLRKEMFEVMHNRMIEHGNVFVPDF